MTTLSRCRGHRPTLKRRVWTRRTMNWGLRPVWAAAVDATLRSMVGDLSVVPTSRSITIGSRRIAAGAALAAVSVYMRYLGLLFLPEGDVPLRASLPGPDLLEPTLGHLTDHHGLKRPPASVSENVSSPNRAPFRDHRAPDYPKTRREGGLRRGKASRACPASILKLESRVRLRSGRAHVGSDNVPAWALAISPQLPDIGASER
jgi:hypothetical protein